LSVPALQRARGVAANNVDVLIAQDGEFSGSRHLHAILVHNADAGPSMVRRRRRTPDSGGRTTCPTGPPTPASPDGSKPSECFSSRACRRATRSVREGAARDAHARHDFPRRRDDLDAAVDLERIRSASLKLAVDPLGGAGVHYWGRIAERYQIDLTVISDTVDPTFGFMTLDWDGRIRMDPSSPYAMQRLIGCKDRFDIAFACDTDHDRHGVVTPGGGLLSSNHYLAVAIDYLFTNRTNGALTPVGKTVIGSA
jgi:phosphoglucomutase